jgi:hypothetical protein
LIFKDFSCINADFFCIIGQSSHIWGVFMRIIRIIYLIILIFCLYLYSQSGTAYHQHEIMNGNNVLTAFNNWGVIAQPRSENSPGAWKYPVNGYFGDFSIMVGGLINFNGTTFSSVEICGANRPFSGDPEISPYGIFCGFEPRALPPNNLALSNRPETWPSNWSQWPFTNEAAFESYFEMDDNNDEEFNNSQYNAYGIQFQPDSTNFNRHGLGLKIESRFRQYNNAGLEDIMLMDYNLINEGSASYRQLVFGALMGTYVGISNMDDSPQEYTDDVCFFDINQNLGLFWDFPMDNSRNPLWIGKPGFAAVVILQSPGNPFDGIDNDRDNSFQPGNTAPFFTASDFNGHTLQTGEKIILIDKNYNRSIMTVPDSSIIVFSCGKYDTVNPGLTFVQEGNSGNLNAFDGIDNDFDGLIDENYDLHYNFSVPHLNSPVAISNNKGPTQYKNYFTGQGLTDTYIDENGQDIDEIGLTSFYYFAPANLIRTGDDVLLLQQLTPGYFNLPSSYSNGYLTAGEDGDFLMGSGFFPLEAGENQKIILGLVYADNPDELYSKVQVLKNINLNTSSNTILEFTLSPTGVYTGNTIPMSWQCDTTQGNVILEYSEDYGFNWKFLDIVPVSEQSFNWDISQMDDGYFYQIRFRHSLNPLRTITSSRFVINHAAPANPQVILLESPAPNQIVSDTLEIRWMAGDAEGSNLTVSLFHSTGQDTSWEFLTDIMDSGSYSLDTRRLPNSSHVLLKILASDGTGMGEAISHAFRINNQFTTINDSLLFHASGHANGLVKIFTVDSSEITGHQYRLSFNDSAEQKSYNVKDLTLNESVLQNCTQLDSSSMGPEFDGVRLLVHDIYPTQIDTSKTCWSRNDITLDFRISLEDYQIPPFGLVKTILMPCDYEIEFFNQVMD